MARFTAANSVLGSIHSAEMVEPGNQLLKSFSLQYWDEQSLMSPCLKRAFVKCGTWAADLWVGVVCEGPVVLLMKSKTWDGSGVTNEEPERQRATFFSILRHWRLCTWRVTPCWYQCTSSDVTSDNTKFRGRLTLSILHGNPTKEQGNEF